MKSRNKLTAAEVAQIRLLYGTVSHPTQRQLAASFNVNPSQISRAVRGLSWSWANGPIYPHKPIRITE